MNTIQIDVEKVIRQKSPFLANNSFFVRWLKKIVHEEGINACLRCGGDVRGAKFAAAVLEFFGTQVDVIDKNNILQNKQGRYVFAANHPLGGLDGVALVKIIGEQFPEIRFPVNDILLSIEKFQPIFMPVNKHGKQGREGVIKINEAYASLDQQIIMFPAGLVSRKIKGKIVDLHWQKHFVSKAIKYQRDIVPVYIEGRNSDRFYRIANWRKYLGIKFNIEMLYLPDEMFRQKNKTIRIIIGKPISYDSLKSYSAEKGAEFIKQEVYALA